MLTSQSLASRLKNLDACDEAIEWASPYGTDAQRAWDECERGDWMLWAVGRTANCPPWSDGRKPLLACSLDVTEMVRHLWSKQSAEKIAAAVQILRDWIGGTATKEQAVEAKAEIFAAAVAALTADAAAHARDAVAYAASAVVNAANVVDAADAVDAANAVHADAVSTANSVYSARAAAYAANVANVTNVTYIAACAAAHAATKKDSFLESARIVRRHFPRHPQENCQCE